MQHRTVPYRNSISLSGKLRHLLTSIFEINFTAIWGSYWILKKAIGFGISKEEFVPTNYPKHTSKSNLKARLVRVRDYGVRVIRDGTSYGPTWATSLYCFAARVAWTEVKYGRQSDYLFWLVLFFRLCYLILSSRMSYECRDHTRGVLITRW